MGLGLAYAGTCKEEVQELLVPIVIDTDVPMEVAGFAALSLGLVFVSTQQEDCVQALLQVPPPPPLRNLSLSPEQHDGAFCLRINHRPAALDAPSPHPSNTRDLAFRFRRHS